MNTQTIKTAQFPNVKIDIDQKALKREVKDGVRAGLGGVAVLGAFILLFASFMTISSHASNAFSLSGAGFIAGLSILALCPPTLVLVIYFAHKDHVKALLTLATLTASVMGTLFGILAA